ncbi:MAG TPA: S-methyl-5-thioribose-1-phosphate isomerase [Chloroflexota bacterium]|nr:S-methyl-5-thioribose-1-phosphate isomerase [Chloroflexota bacterium]
MLDQRALPLEELWVEAASAQEVAKAIRDMAIRGAPLIGVAAAFGMALAAAESLDDLRAAAAELKAARPTAVNLAWAVDRMLAAAERQPTASALLDEAQRIADEDAAMSRQLSQLGAKLLPAEGGVLTHCNAGMLAMIDYGSALGVIRAAHEAGKRLHVFVDETRPFLQGARLTAWELRQLGIPMTLITDSMAGWFMQRGEIQAVVTGADRIAANGDTANKIGTYSVAVLAREHGLPMYVAAPVSTIDAQCPSGDHIPIEQRPEAEVTHAAGVRTAPEGVHAANPAFDVTPARLISGIITNEGIAYPPFTADLARFVRRGREGAARQLGGR